MDNHNVVAIQNPQADALTQVLRERAPRLLARAIEAEVEELLECHAERRTEDGRTSVIRSGYQPERDLQTGIGPVRVRIPKVRAKVGDEAKFPDAVECPTRDRDTLMTFFDFPAEHGRSVRTTNPIESTFGTVRHRTRRAKGCVSRDRALHMIFKLGSVAETHWRRLRGFNRLAEVVAGIPFKDGVRATR